MNLCSVLNLALVRGVLVDASGMDLPETACACESSSLMLLFVLSQKDGMLLDLRRGSMHLQRFFFFFSFILFEWLGAQILFHVTRDCVRGNLPLLDSVLPQLGTCKDGGQLFGCCER